MLILNMHFHYGVCTVRYAEVVLHNVMFSKSSVYQNIYVHGYTLNIVLPVCKRDNILQTGSIRAYSKTRVTLKGKHFFYRKENILFVNLF